MTSVDPAYPPTGGTYPPPPSGYTGQTQLGQPMGVQFGQPMGTQFGQPMGAQLGQPMGTQYGQPMGVQYAQPVGQPSTAVVIVQQPNLKFRNKHARPCPHCQVGVVTNQPTLLGWILFGLFFPIGIVCCVLLAERKCSNCKVVQN